MCVVGLGDGSGGWGGDKGHGQKGAGGRQRLKEEDDEPIGGIKGAAVSDHIDGIFI
jgi:hypothetical protein